jgi:hypothetical protein
MEHDRFTIRDGHFMMNEHSNLVYTTLRDSFPFTHKVCSTLQILTRRRKEPLLKLLSSIRKTGNKLTTGTFNKN